MNAEYKKWQHVEYDNGEPLFDVYINGELAAVAKTKNNAAHIVHCVNNHDALVESLYNLASACSQLIEWGEFLDDGPMAAMVNNALELCKETQGIQQ